MTLLERLMNVLDDQPLDNEVCKYCGRRIGNEEHDELCQWAVVKAAIVRIEEQDQTLDKADEHTSELVNKLEDKEKIILAQCSNLGGLRRQIDELEATIKSMGDTYRASAEGLQRQLVAAQQARELALAENVALRQWAISRVPS